MSRLVIKQHRPLQLILTVVLVSLLLSTLVWMFLDESHWSFIRSRGDATGQVKELWESNQFLEKENLELRDKVLLLERTAEIDHKTSLEVKQQLLKLQEQYYHAKTELEFYEGIMDSTRDSKGLNIQGLYLDSQEEGNRYRYRLVLTNVAKGDKLVEGKVTIYIDGDQEGSAKSLNLKDLENSRNQDFSFAFKNFKKFDGYFHLPEGFIPNRVTVQLKNEKEAQRSVQRDFDWQSLSPW